MEGGKRFVEHSLDAYADFRSLSRSWERIWFNKDTVQSRRATLDLLLETQATSKPRAWQYHATFWDSLKKLGVWDNPTLVRKLARTCLDEVSKRDDDGDELHWIRKRGAQLGSGNWKAWQRDLSGNQLRIQFWRQGNCVEFAAVAKAHKDFNPPTPMNPDCVSF